MGTWQQRRQAYGILATIPTATSTWDPSKNDNTLMGPWQQQRRAYGTPAVLVLAHTARNGRGGIDGRCSTPLYQPLRGWNPVLGLGSLRGRLLCNCGVVSNTVALRSGDVAPRGNYPVPSSSDP